MHVDDDEGDPEAVLGDGPQRMLSPPAFGVAEPRRIVDAPDLADPLGAPVGWQRQHHD
jgi:hypothetical protein